ncbi:MAG TPA: YciI family protein [Bauldia sp.]|nr:YciI family protein [Bauldia sp.]
MPYLIDATDKPGQAELRQRHRPEHLAFLHRSLPRLLAAGAKLSDDGNTALGSIYIVEVEDRAGAEAFIAEDPYVKANLFRSVVITRWRKGFFNHESFIPKS